MHDVGEHAPVSNRLITRLLAGFPIWVHVRPGDAVNYLLPRRLRPSNVDASQSGRVGKEVANENRILIVVVELGDVLHNAVVDVELAALP